MKQAIGTVLLSTTLVYCLILCSVFSPIIVLARPVENVQLNEEQEFSISGDVSGFVSVELESGYAGDLFYWFCPPRNGDLDSPLILWIQGGPGSSGVAWGLLRELGPWKLVDGQMQKRQIAWNNDFAVLFIDQPVGTGYSVAKNPSNSSNYAQNEHDIGAGLTQFMMKWHDLGLWKNTVPFYIAGESYAGHYVPAFAQHVIRSKAPLNLQGIAIGDGLTDPAVQIEDKVLQAYYFSLIGEELRLECKQLMLKAVQLCSEGDFLGARRLRSEIEDKVITASGVNPYDVRRFGQGGPYSMEDLKTWLNDEKVKAMLNVPPHLSWETNPLVGEGLDDDLMRSWASAFPELIRTLPQGVLLYQGQFDWKDGVTENERWIRQLDWEHADVWRQAPRGIWRSKASKNGGDGTIYGFAKACGKLTEVVVAGAGHMVPMDQPEASLDLITRFIRGEPFIHDAKSNDKHLNEETQMNGNQFDE